MTNSDTIRRAARPRKTLTEEQVRHLSQLREELEDAQVWYRRGVVQVLKDGCSFNEVSKATGLSKDTLQRWKRAAGK